MVCKEPSLLLFTFQMANYYRCRFYDIAIDDSTVYVRRWSDGKISILHPKPKGLAELIESLEEDAKRWQAVPFELPIS